jgi:thioredoxin reductase (NADPH)
MAFPYLTEDMTARLHAYGQREIVAAQTVLWSRGQREVDMFVVLNGNVTVYARRDGDECIAVATLEENQFSGELDLLSSRQTLVEGCTASDSVLLRITRADLRRLMRAEGDIANLIMQATIWRRFGIVEAGDAGITLIGYNSCGDTQRLRRFLIRNTYPHRLAEPDAEQCIGTETSPLGKFLLPAVVLLDGRILHRPSIAELADQLGLDDVIAPGAIQDLTIVGAGPSGLAAAVYGASEGLSTVVIEGVAPGGQAGTSSKIENYLGFPTGVTGQGLTNRALSQAQKFGARFLVSRQVTSIEQVDGIHHVKLAGGAVIRSRAVVIATGAAYRKLSVSNYERFEGQGIQYAATPMEASMCKDQEVAVVGGGNSAGQAAVFLAGIAKHVHLLIRGGSLASTMSNYLIGRIETSSRITIHPHTEIDSLDGDTSLRCVTFTNRRTGESLTRSIENLFIMIGAEPNTGWLFGVIALDKKGFILAGADGGFNGSRYATNIPGVFAVGDVRSGSVKRVASAVGEGSIVVADIHRYLAAQREPAAGRDSSASEFLAIAP